MTQPLHPRTARRGGLLIIAAVGVLGLAACSGAGKVTELADEAATAKNGQRGETADASDIPVAGSITDDLDTTALQMVWPQFAPQICPPYRDLVSQGIDEDMIANFAIAKLEEGYGESISTEAKDLVVELLGEC